MRLLEKIRMRLQMLLHRGRESRPARCGDGVPSPTTDRGESRRRNEPEEARSAALRVFGNPVVLREQAREPWSWNGSRLWPAIFASARARCCALQVRADCDPGHGSGHRCECRAVYAGAFGSAAPLAVHQSQPARRRFRGAVRRQLRTTPLPAVASAHGRSTRRVSAVSP